MWVWVLSDPSQRAVLDSRKRMGRSGRWRNYGSGFAFPQCHLDVFHKFHEHAKREENVRYVNASRLNGCSWACNRFCRHRRIKRIQDITDMRAAMTPPAMAPVLMPVPT